jgi:hypothetical protein
MSIASEIERIKANIANAYAVCEGKGATMPAILNSANLAECINSITGEITAGYIEDGLAIHFSGEDGYAIETVDDVTTYAWVDRVSGYKFSIDSKSSVPTYDNENKLYKQTGAGIMIGNFKIPGNANYTFEAVFRDIKNSSNPTHNDYNAIVGGDMNNWEVTTSSIAMGKNKTDNAIWCALYGISRINIANDEFEDNGLTTFTIVPSVGIFRDGIKISDCGVPNAERGISLFGHTSGPYTYYTRSTGKIHSVRMYNRQLTAEEVLHNYETDIAIYGA